MIRVFTLFALLVTLIPNPLSAHTETVTVKMTKDSFEPRNVEVDLNSFVNFVNVDTKDHWPASNLHPTHELYREFDPKKPIPPQQSWIFKPKKIGVWKFHDHLFPHRRGTLTVVDETKTEEQELNNQLPPYAQVSMSTELEDKVPSRRFFDSIRNTFWDVFFRLKGFFFGITNRSQAPISIDKDKFLDLAEDEQYTTLGAISKSEGSRAAWEFVRDVYTDTAGKTWGAGRAHDLAHFAGDLIYQQKGITGLSLCDSTFAFGCYHGFTERAFTKSLDKLHDIAVSCGSLGAVGSGPWASCIHGIGHGVATYFDSVELEDALAACDTLTAGETYCHDGVFMEFSFTAPESFYKKDDALYPCNSLGAKYRQACGRNQPYVMKLRLKRDFDNIVAACLASQDKTIRHFCIDAVGLGVGQESGGNPNVVVEQCGRIDDAEAIAQCKQAAAGELVFQNVPGWKTATGQICNSLASPWRQQCFERINRLAADYDR